MPADPPSSPAGMVLIPAGPFEMGRQSGADGDELPVHTVTVSAFYLDQFEVTKALWDDVKTYADAYGYTFSNSGSGVGAFHPVHTVNWYDCVKWCNARSEKEGLAPVYYTDAGFTTVYKTGEGTAPFANWAANGFRLPTEAEWEKAARGTLGGQYLPVGEHHRRRRCELHGSGDPFETVSEPPRWDSTTAASCPRVSTAPTATGSTTWRGTCLSGAGIGMIGRYYDSSPATDPRGGTSASGERVLRGGSWDFELGPPALCDRRDLTIR